MGPLHDELRRAFPPVPLDARRAFAWESDATLCERAVTGRSWEEVDPRVLAGRTDTLALLDDARFTAWLPMYLAQLACSLEPALLWHLLGRLGAKTIIDRLTDAQRRAVARFLQYVRDVATGGASRRAQHALACGWAGYVERATFREDPRLPELVGAFPPTAIVVEAAFVDADWEHAGTYEYRQALDGRTWVELDHHLLREEVHGLVQLGDDVIRALAPAYLHVAIVCALAGEAMLARIERLAWPAAQQRLVTAYLAAARRVAPSAG